MDKESKKKFWLDHVQAQKESGLTQIQYCVENNLKKFTFNYWRKKIVKNVCLESRNLIPIKLNSLAEEKTYCTIEYAHGIRIKIQSKEMLSILPDLLTKI